MKRRLRGASQPITPDGSLPHPDEVRKRRISPTMPPVTRQLETNECYYNDHWSVGCSIAGEDYTMGMRWLSLSVVLLSCGLFGQRLDFGVEGGIPISEAFRRGGFYSIHACPYGASCGESGDFATRRYVIGPVVEVRLSHSLGLESSALYRRLGYDTYGFIINAANHTAATSNSWEVPVLIKYRTHHLRSVTPYGVAGVAFRHTGRFATRSEYYSAMNFPYSNVLTLQGTSTGNVPPLNSWTSSLVAGAGFELGTAHLRFSPEIRYNRWMQYAIGQFGSDVRSEPNQIDFLLGIRYRVAH